MERNMLYLSGMVFLVLMVALFTNANTLSTPTGNVIGGKLGNLKGLPGTHNLAVPDHLNQPGKVIFEGREYKNYCLSDEHPEYKYTQSRNYLKRFFIADNQIKSAWTNCEVTDQICEKGRCTGAYDPRKIPNKDEFQREVWK
ncbi:hypothetical protein HYY69_07950 [Candidatus Woesearchaeota archaeon]|nr:hypothetical protein [Candidatus Woesearchaeota archaeon]